MRRACALTGHRELPPDFNTNALYDCLEEIIKAGCDTFFCGMAEGFDLKALECLKDLKGKYRIYIEACIPYEGQEMHFPPELRKKYRELLMWCDRKTVLFPNYRNGCFLIRNRYMVDCADFLLAYCTKPSGGTAYTVNYAREKGKTVEFFSTPY
ncbi:MAG: DUF1273 domain-containing protein [Clostridiales bacterium]|nr:DUF1273 domain-containing protein [Clostridiales bacterium]